MKLSVVVPAYNEEKTIGQVLKELIKLKQVRQVVVVDDGSTDKTKSEIGKVKSPKIISIHQSNQGKGAAIRKALELVTGDYVLIQDADLEYHPSDIPPMVVAAESREGVEVVYGSRFLGPHSNLLFWHYVGNKLINFLTNIMYDTTLSDIETGYKLVPTELMRSLDLGADSFDFEPEITCKLLKRKVRIFEVPISYVGRDFSQGKKITWKDGFQAVWTVIKLRL